MNVGTRVFWGIIVILLSASVFYGFGVEARRGKRELPSAEPGAWREPP